MFCGFGGCVADRLAIVKFMLEQICTCTAFNFNAMALMQGPLEGTAIFIDTFTVPRWSPGGVFFLTHAHSDHMKGLNPQWRAGKIHLSTTTAAIVRHAIPHARLVCHALGEPFAVEDPLHPHRTMTATFVDANHCAGSIIVVLEGLPQGPIVHTGDFRYHPGLRDNVDLQRVAKLGCKLFLDVTFASRCTPRFPEKGESICQVLDLIDRHAVGLGEIVFLETVGLGDEELLAAVATHLRHHSCLLHIADEKRFRVLSLFDPGLCHACCAVIRPAERLRNDHRVVVVSNLESVRRLRSTAPGRDAIHVSCSTLWWAKRACVHQGGQPVYDHMYNIWHVLWSMHSSFDELSEFVAWMAPLTIQPTCPMITCGDSSNAHDAVADLVAVAGVESIVNKTCLVTEPPCALAATPPMATNQTATAAAFAEEMRLFCAPKNAPDTLLALLDSQLPDDYAALATGEGQCTPTLPGDDITPTEIDSDSEVSFESPILNKRRRL